MRRVPQNEDLSFVQETLEDSVGNMKKSGHNVQNTLTLKEGKLHFYSLDKYDNTAISGLTRFRKKFMPIEAEFFTCFGMIINEAGQ